MASGSADGSARTGPPPQRMVTGGCDTYVKIWRLDAASGEWIEESKLEGHSDWVRDVAWAPSIGLPRSIIASCSQVLEGLIHHAVCVYINFRHCLLSKKKK